MLARWVCFGKVKLLWFKDEANGREKRRDATRRGGEGAGFKRESFCKLTNTTIQYLERVSKMVPRRMSSPANRWLLSRPPSSDGPVRERLEGHHAQQAWSDL